MDENPSEKARPSVPPTTDSGEDRPPATPPESEPPAAPRPKLSGIRKAGIYVLILVASIFIGAQLFNSVIMPAFVGHHDEVRVPDLSGKSMVEAERVLAQTELRLGDTRQRYGPQPPGTIVDQHPDAGTIVKSGRTVAVIVSRGESGGVVPNLEGQTLRNARLALESAGLTLGEVATVPSDQAGRDAIIATEPGAGANAPRGTPVNVLVSAGGAGRAYVMPDLKGRDAGGIEPILKQAGFTVQVEAHGVGFFLGRRRVVDQVPEPGARVVPGATITLYTD